MNRPNRNRAETLRRALLALLAAGAVGLAGRGGAAEEPRPAATLPAATSELATTPPARPALSPAPAERFEPQLAQQARPARPDDVETAFNDAFAASLAGRPAEAERRYREVEERFPESPRAEEAAFYRALLLSERGETEAARELLAALAARRPPGRYADDALFRLAELHEQRLHEFTRAIELYDRLARDFPESNLNSSAAYQAANIHVYNDRNFPEAQRRFDAVRDQAADGRREQEPGPAGARAKGPPAEPSAPAAAAPKALSKRGGGFGGVLPLPTPAAAASAAEVARRTQSGPAATAAPAPSGGQAAGVTQQSAPDAGQSARREWLRAEAERRGRFLQEHRDHEFRPLDRLVRAQEATQAGRSDEARELLRGLRADFPDSAVVDDALFAEAELERLAGATEAAVGLYAELVRDYADSPHAAAAQYQLGEYYRFVGREAEARAAWQAAAARGAGSLLGERAAARLAELELDRGAFRAQKRLQDRAGQARFNAGQAAEAEQRMADEGRRAAGQGPAGSASGGGAKAKE